MNNSYPLRRTHYSYVYFYIMIISTLILILSLAYSQSFITSLATKLLIVANVMGGIWALSHLISLDTQFTQICILIIAFGCLSLFLNTIFTNGAISALYDNIVSLIGFLAFPLYVMYFQYIQTGNKIKNFIYCFSILASFIFIYLSTTPLRNIIYTDWGIGHLDAITLGYSNSNQAGMYLLVCAIILVSSLFYYKNKLLKFLLVGDIIYLAYLIYGTESRACLLLFILFLGLIIYIKHFQIRRWQIWLILFIPFLYIMLATGILPWMQKTLILGQSISTGREVIYERYFADFNIFNFIFGDYVQFHFQNMHNGYISILATTGLITFIVYFIFCHDMLSILRTQGNTTRSETVAFIGILCIILHSSVEAAFLTGGVIYASLFGMLYALSLNPTSQSQYLKSKN